MRRLLLSLALAAAATLAAGCDCSGDTCVSATLNCPCDEDGTCTRGLSCVDGVCVSPTPRVDAGPNDAGERMDIGGFVMRDARVMPDVGPNPDAFFADDPPPMLCLPDGGMGPVPNPPGGTPDCPDDKNREGCRCPEAGETAPCWPGLRVNRMRGICRDGTTTCEPFDEFTGRWGPCQGAILPAEGVELGPRACGCFSRGTWRLDNLSPCFINQGEDVYAVSTVPETGRCPEPQIPPQPASSIWTADRLTVDCEGSFELCYTLKAGDYDNPLPSDCTVTRVCTGQVWYPERDVETELPPLPAWADTAPSECARQFRDTGGYGEMTVLGRSIECDDISDGGMEYVFNRVNYCALECNQTPPPAGLDCDNCRMGGSGSF